MDETLVEAIRSDYTQAKLSEPDRAMLDYVAQLTKDATKLGAQSVEGLRRHGFNDTAILQITLLASLFNYFNRVADALGVGRGK